jgi:hypothetical protein
VRERVLARWRGSTNRRQRSGMQPQRIANIIETQCVGKLCLDQTGHMTPRTEGSTLFLHCMGTDQARDQMIGNQIAKLPQQRKLTGGWLTYVCLFMPYLVAMPQPASQLFLMT